MSRREREREGINYRRNSHNLLDQLGGFSSLPQHGNSPNPLLDEATNSRSLLDKVVPRPNSSIFLGGFSRGSSGNDLTELLGQYKREKNSFGSNSLLERLGHLMNTRSSTSYHPQRNIQREASVASVGVSDYVKATSKVKGNGMESHNEETNTATIVTNVPTTKSV